MTLDGYALSISESSRIELLRERNRPDETNKREIAEIQKKNENIQRMVVRGKKKTANFCFFFFRVSYVFFLILMMM